VPPHFAITQELPPSVATEANAAELDGEALQQQILRVYQSVLDGCAELAGLGPVSEQQLRQLFSQAGSAYLNRDYSAALPDFAVILLYRPHRLQNYLALASTLQQLERYQDALGFYLLATQLFAREPQPLYQMGECLLALEETDTARDTLRVCQSLCAEDARHAPLLAQTDALLLSLH